MNEISILNKTPDKSKPYYDFKYSVLVIPNTIIKYRYFIEVKEVTKDETRYLLFLSTSDFNENCRKCRVDDYHRIKINLKGEIKDIAIASQNNNGNVNIEFISSNLIYEIYEIIP